MKKPSLISLFAGAGGLDIGLEQAGFRTIFANEIEPYACESLRANSTLRSLKASDFDGWFSKQIIQQRCYNKASPGETAKLRRRLSTAFNECEKYLNHACIVQQDIRDLSVSDVLQATRCKPGDVDLVAGGPPCQPFSRSGKKEVIESDMGQLFLDFIRMVDGLRPRWFLFENVKGLVLHKADVVSHCCPKCGKKRICDFQDRDVLKNVSHVDATCTSCSFEGAHEVVWERKKAGSLDVIQGEFERIGYRCHSTVLNASDFGAPQHRERLFIVGSRDGESLSWPSALYGETALRQAPDLFDDNHGKLRRPSVNDILYRNGHWRYGNLDPAKAVLWVKNVVRPHDEPVTWTLNRPAPTIGAHQSAKLAIAPFGVPEKQLQRQQWHVLGRRQGDTAPVSVEHEYLTDEELLKLQTFPHSWYLYGTRMQRAFQIGNAVPPILAKVVGKAILKEMEP